MMCHILSPHNRVLSLDSGPGSEVAQAEFAHAQCGPGTWGLEADADNTEQAGHPDPRGVF